MKRLVVVGLLVLIPLSVSAHHRPWHKPTTTTTTTTTLPATTTTLDTEAAGTCPTTTDGAPAGSPVRGPSTIINSQTITNVVYDGNHSDDLVRVYGVHVIFDHVTFRGTGTGSTGHTVEVKRGGSVEIRNSLWAGRPSEDSIQFGGPNGDQHANRSVVKCSTIGGTPGEDHVDIKVSQVGAVVDFIDNRFSTVPPSGRTIQNDGSVGVQHFLRNTGVADALMEHTVASNFVGNSGGELYLYEARDWLVQANTMSKVGHGESSGNRSPTGIYYRDNTFGQFGFYGGTCWATGNNLTLSQCTAGAPGWYPR